MRAESKNGPATATAENAVLPRANALVLIALIVPPPCISRRRAAPPPGEVLRPLTGSAHLARPWKYILLLVAGGSWTSVGPMMASGPRNVPPSRGSQFILPDRPILGVDNIDGAVIVQSTCQSRDGDTSKICPVSFRERRSVGMRFGGFANGSPLALISAAADHRRVGCRKDPVEPPKGLGAMPVS